MALLILLGLLLGITQGLVHAQRVRQNGRVERKVKVHWTLARLLLIGGAAFVLLRISGGERTLLQVASMALAALIFFAPVFRFTMAHELTDKGWHPYYLGATSYYDRLLLWWRLGYDVGRDKLAHYRAFHNDEAYRGEVITTGGNAYDIEYMLTIALCGISALI